MKTNIRHRKSIVLLEDHHVDDITYVTECHNYRDGCIIYQRRTSYEKETPKPVRKIVPSVNVQGDFTSFDIDIVGPQTLGNVWRAGLVRLFLEETLGFSKSGAYEIA